jgi:hypothetical protein
VRGAEEGAYKYASHDFGMGGLPDASAAWPLDECVARERAPHDGDKCGQSAPQPAPTLVAAHRTGTSCLSRYSKPVRGKAQRRVTETDGACLAPRGGGSE